MSDNNKSPNIAAKLSMARLRAGELAPYMSSILYLMIPTEDKRCPTMGITQKCVLFYSPEFVEEKTVNELSIVLLHEAMHIYQDHWSRMDGRKHDLWNISADCEVDDDLERIDFLPEGMLVPQKFGLPPNKPAEWYYTKILENAIEIPCPNDMIMGDSDDSNPGDSDQKTQDGNNQQNEPTSGRTQSEIEAARTSTSEAIKQQGDVPGGLLRMAEKLTAPPLLDWKTELTAATVNSVATTKYGMSDYSFGRPNKRHQKSKILFPSMITHLPKVGVLIDTSGSMSEEDVGAGLAQIRHILSNLGSEVYLAVVDCSLQYFGRAKTVAEITTKLKGGGGTDLRPGFDKLTEVKCDVIIAVSDCYASFPEKQPAGKTIFLIPNGGTMAPWGKQVFMSGKTP
jgi:predicted metal-dependent peptidase